MDQFDREDSSTYTDNGPVREPQPVVEPAKKEPVQPVFVQPSKQKKSKAPLILTLLLLIALAGAGTLGWMWYQQNGELDNVRADLSSQRNKVAQLESQRKAEQMLEENADKALTTETKDTESEAIVKAGLAYAKADVRNKNTEAKLDKTVGDFSQVTITTESTNAAGKVTFGEILKKVNDQWVVVWASEVGIPDDVVAKYAVPKEFTGKS